MIGLIIPILGQGQTNVQYFDGADTSASNSIMIEIDTAAANIWQIGPPQKVIFDSAATFPNAIVTDTVKFYPANNTSSFRIRIANAWFSPWGILAMQWMQKLDMDTKYDGGFVEFSIDSGVTWQNAFYSPYVYNFYGFDPSNQDLIAPSGEYAFSGTDSTWKNIWLCFDLSWINSVTDTVHFRFTLKSDSINNNKEGWMIDNMYTGITAIHTVNESEQEKYMSVSPNPTTGRVEITTKKLDQFHIIERMELVNMEGRVVQQWGTSPTKFYIDISNHPPGIYFLKVKTNINSETFKIILKQ